MPCDFPISAWYGKTVNPVTGKRALVFKHQDAFFGVDKPLVLPCGQCTGCRLAHSLSWGIRCMHEKMMHQMSCFGTLTYDDAHLPADGSLNKDHCRLFMYKLREHVMRKFRMKGLRFYMCGEYGAKSNRPHYHYLFLNWDFFDKKFYKSAKGGEKLYTSEFLGSLWEHGSHLLGEVTLESACYVTRYITDKITGDRADDWYMGRLPEFVNMSRRPGIGSSYYAKYGEHAHRSGDFAILAGKRVKMPRFYDTRFELVDSAELSVLKSVRQRKARLHAADNLVDRRKVRRIVRDSRMSQFKRELS